MQHSDGGPTAPHYLTVGAVLKRLAPARVLMGGLGNAWLPQALPDTQFVAVERNESYRCGLPNVRVIHGDWHDHACWPDERFDVILYDVSGSDQFADMLAATRSGSVDAVRARLAPDGVLVGAVLRARGPVSVAITRFEEREVR